MSDQYLDQGDMQTAAALLHIVEKCAGHSGKLGSLSNAAMAALMKINDSIKVKASEEAKAKAEEEAALKAAERDEKDDGDDKADGTFAPSVFPRDSQTATIADNNVPRRV